MAYSEKVVKRFNDVLNNPAAHGVGRFDPNDPKHVGISSCLIIHKCTYLFEPFVFSNYGHVVVLS